MKNLSAFLAKVMLTGTLAAAVVIAAGLVWFLVAHSGLPAGDHLFTGEPRDLRDPVAIARHAVEIGSKGESLSVVMLGLLILLAGPVVRVGLAGFGYLLERDRLYVAVSAFVLLVLLVSFFW